MFSLAWVLIPRFLFFFYFLFFNFGVSFGFILRQLLECLYIIALSNVQQDKM